MKKILLCASALALGGVVLAQTPTANNLRSNSLTPALPALPGAGADANSGLSTQNGTFNKVKVRQAGVNQSVLTYQDNGSNAEGGNQAEVWQFGHVQGNTANSGQENNAIAVQRGSWNQSRTIQQGDFNNSAILQGTLDASSKGNRAQVQQGVAGNAEGNFAGIAQDGQDNVGAILQTYDNNKALMFQKGKGNESYIRQFAGPNQSEGHNAITDQDGKYNKAYVKQKGPKTNDAGVYQLGSRNSALQDQDSRGYDQGNNGYIIQGSTVSPSATAPRSFDLYNDIDSNVDQIRLGAFTPGSVGAKAVQYQEGGDNEALIGQFGSGVVAGNEAMQEQYGKRNVSLIAQNATGNPNGGANYARQYQVGYDNEAGIAQNGFEHKAYQRQMGEGNIALSAQRGQHNLVNTYQKGDKLVAHTAQRGKYNQAHVVQHGANGQSYSVQQNVQGKGGGNAADILQMGPGGDFHKGAVKCEFPGIDLEDCPIDFDPVHIENPCPDC